MIRRRLTGFVLAGAVLASAAAEATVLVPMDLTELVAAAPLIAHVRVVSVETQWTDGRRQIETLVTAEVAEDLKGHSGRTVMFRVPGGQLGPYKSVFVGAPQFVEGDEAVVFLNAQPPRMPHLVGLGLGAHRIARSEAGASVLTPAGWHTPGDVPVRLARGDRQRRPVELAAFKERIRRLADGGSAR